MSLPCTGQSSFVHDTQLSTLEFQTDSQNSTSELNTSDSILRFVYNCAYFHLCLLYRPFLTFKLEAY